MMTLGQRVKELREQLRLRPEHLAVAVNVSVATIYNLENDKHTIRADRILPLAKVLQVSPLELLELLAEAEEKPEGERETAGVV